MSTRRLLCMLPLILILVTGTLGAGSRPSTYLANPNAAAKPASISLNKSTEYTTSFQILGVGRQNFNPDTWMLAKAGGTTRYTIRYTVSVREDVALWFDREIVKPQSYKRTATIVSCQESANFFCASIELEDGTVKLAKDADEARQLMFDFKRTYSIKGSALGAGTHKLWTKVQAEWSGYLFKGSDQLDGKTTPRVKVVVAK